MADLSKLTHEEVLYLLSLLPEDSTILRDKLEIIERRLRPAKPSSNRVVIGVNGRRAEIVFPQEVLARRGEVGCLEMAKRQAMRIYHADSTDGMQFKKDRQNGHFIITVVAEKPSKDVQTMKAVVSRLSDADREALKELFN